VAADVDILIAGAGASGLSLAVRLANRTSLTVQVIEPRPETLDDRTFCYFRGRAHPFEAAVARRFERVEVRDPQRAVRVDVSARPYEELPSGAFQALAARLLAGSGRVRVDRGVGLRAFHETAEGVRAITTRGEVRARLLVDARGGSAMGRASDARSQERDVRWLQHFVGHVVRTERPCFEPDTALLMDFGVSQAEGPHFVYVLPRSAHEALVEDTYFSSTSLPRERYDATLRGWLEQRRAGHVETLRSEHGQIPMTTAPQARVARSRIVVIGQRGGAAKPSSGYAFQFIQRQCDALVDVLARQGVGHPVRWLPPRSQVTTFFDRVFLSYLRRHPTSAPEVFVPLFADVPGEALARFLSEEGTLIDHLRVMNAVPRLGVVAEALRSRDVWLRSR